MNLRLLQLGDSALPIGGYSQSWGLEAAVERGLVRDPAELESWVRGWLSHAVAPCEGVVVAAVCRAVANDEWDSVARADELLAVSLAPVTLRNASREMGEQLRSLAESWPWAESAIRNPQSAISHHAVVFAILAASAGAGSREALAVYLHQSALGVIAAGVKAVPVGHTHGQQILARLHDDIAELARDFADAELETAGSFCPALEILCHAQGRLYTRLFRS
jgi:urease accessory protein